MIVLIKKKKKKRPPHKSQVLTAIPAVSSQQCQTKDEFRLLPDWSKEMHDDPFQLRVSNLFNLLWPKYLVYGASLTSVLSGDHKAEAGLLCLSLTANDP